MILAIQSANLYETFLFVFGGLGIFLYGINLMGDSLKDLAGNKLKLIIEKSTNTPLKGILVGALLTGIIQSSSGTTALTVGLVRAGLMTLPQAVGIIMGANIGTTITALMIGLNVEEYSLIFIAIGAILIFFFNNRKVKDLGRVICGFGLLFFGLQLIGSGLDYIQVEYSAQINSLFQTLGRFPILGLFIGTLITAIVQSSSATIGILQTLYATGELSLLGALPILIGCNIGTTVTAVIAAIGGGTEAKRTAVVHSMFNVVGALFFMILLRWAFVPLMEIVNGWLVQDGEVASKMTIAIAHFAFNFITTFILYFFVNLMVKIACKLIKASKTPLEEQQQLLDELLDYSLIKKSPSLALEFVSKCINHMGGVVNYYYTLTKDFALEYKEKDLETAKTLEDTIDQFDKRIHDYLINLTIENVSAEESQCISRYLDSIKDYERIGDHCSNIIDFFVDRHKRNLTLSLDSVQDLTQMLDAVAVMVENATNSLSSWDLDKAKVVEETERLVDKMNDSFHERHNHRVNQGLCTYENSDYYVELLSNLERIGDHCKNVADAVLHINRSTVA